MATISEALATAIQHHQAGQLQAAEQIYQQILAIDPNHVETLHLLGLAASRQGRPEAAVELIRRAVALQPDFAEAHNSLGNSLWVQGQLKDAFQCFRRAAELKPDFTEAYVNLANAFLFHGQLDEAVFYCHRALELNPNYALAHNNFGNALLTLGRFDEAVQSYRRAVELKPDDAEAHSNLANALQQLRQFDEASAHYARALELRPDHAHAHYARATLQLLTGDFASGWPEYEWRLKTNEHVRRKFPTPRWDGSALEKRTILLHAEQCLGDTIQFIRFAALIKKQHPAATVIVECQRSLIKLLAECPGVDRLIARGGDLPHFDVQASLMSLPEILRTSWETIPAEIPYLVADSALVNQWRERLEPVRGILIGINWRGRPNTRHRDIPIESFRSLAKLPGVRLISLQKGEASADIFGADRDGSPFGDLGEDFDTAHGAFVDTAAIMLNLDLVISCDTSIPHLAGALGVPVWLALPFVPDWRWLLDRRDSPWYPTMRLFRQQTPGDWSGVFEEIQSALQERL